MEFNKELDAKHKEILNDIKKNLADVSKESNLLNMEMFMCIASLHQGNFKGSFEYIFEKDSSQMQIYMNKYLLIKMIADIAQSVFKDNYELISMLLGYSLMKNTIESVSGKEIREETKIDCNGKTQEEIDLIKKMFKKSPEELAKIKEQMNE